MKAGQPPGGTLLPVEPTRPFPADALEASLERRLGSLEPYTMSSADFDVVLLTPLVVYHELRASTDIPHTTSKDCLLYTSPSPRDRTRSRMPSSA